MTIATVSLSNRTLQSNCVVSVRAIELSEPKLHLRLEVRPVLETGDGERVGEDMIRYFCGEGIAHARRRLGLIGGLSLEIYKLSGIIRKGAEIGISYAISIAIAESLRKPAYKSLLGDIDCWEATTAHLSHPE